jgi:hypothetical protein
MKFEKTTECYQILKIWNQHLISLCGWKFVSQLSLELHQKEINQPHFIYLGFKLVTTAKNGEILQLMPQRWPNANPGFNIPS